MSSEEKNRNSDLEGLVISSRIRLARNLKGSFFPHKLSEKRKKELNEKITGIFMESGRGLKETYSVVDLSDISPIERGFLSEKYLISPQLIEKAGGIRLIISKDESLSIILEDEDHIRIQSIKQGFLPEEAYKPAERLALYIEQQMDIAYDRNFGFLTACATNTGTGLRASVMMHLPALAELSQINRLSEQLSQLGMTVRGSKGEGSMGNYSLFQISNEITLGLSEEDLIRDLKQAVKSTAELERNAEKVIWEQQELKMKDRFFRGRAVLEHARLMSSEEAEKLLSDLRWAAMTGFYRDMSPADVSDLMMDTGTYSIQRKAGKVLSMAKRDELRAEMIRKRLTSFKKGKNGQN